MLSKRYKAGILTYVLAIGMLVSIGLSMMILYVYYSITEYKRYEIQIKLTENLEIAREMALAEVDYFDYDQEYSFDLYSEGTDSIRITKTQWGLWDIFKVSAISGPFADSLIFSAGYTLDSRGKSAIYVMDEGRPIAVAGSTKLIGDCYIPVSGIQSAFVGRIGYQNAELIYGRELKSEKELPEIQLEQKFEELQKLQGLWADYSIDTIRNSYFGEPLLISGSKLNLSGIYDGKVLIRATNSVTLDSIARTSGVMVYAPKIEIKGGFVGDGQFFATDTLIIHKGAEIKYPSVLAVYNRKEVATIQVKEGAKVLGTLLIDGDDPNFRDRVLYLEDAAEFEGMIYCNGMLETYADITGHVTTRKFLVNAPSAVYENYIFNTTIDYTKLDTAFLALSQWFYSEDARVMEKLR